MRALLYRPSWQALRVSFLKENRNDGGWTTPEGTDQNIRDLINYVTVTNETWNDFHIEAHGMGWKVQHEEAVRLYRAINALNAVRMGNSGQGTKGSDQDKLVLMVRDELQQRQRVVYHELLTYASVRWDWRVVRQELQDEYNKGNMHGKFLEIYQNLRTRHARSLLLATRPELKTFMTLMEEVRRSG